MAWDEFGRRDMLRWSAGGSAGLMLTPAAEAKGLLDLLGLGNGTNAPNIKPLNLLRIVAAILELEQTADARGLPRSTLSLAGSGGPLQANDTSLYQAALPRLVTVIDRAEETDPTLSNQAAEILADLNATQREVPESLKSDAPLSTSVSFSALKDEYARLFASAQIRSDHAETLNWHINALKTFRPRYEVLGKPFGIPWYFIGAIHGLEASFNFRAHLHNGDYPLTSRTRQVPANRPPVWGPPSDWESSAKDALKLLGFTGQSDWSIERILYRFEAYNGFGYRKRGVATPYIWSFSNHYERGKFVSDGRWNANAQSQQCGAGVVIKALANAGEISFT